MTLSSFSIKAYEAGSGHRILKGKTGTLYTGKKGSIIVAKAAKVGVDEHLWLAAQLLTEAVGCCMMISSIDTGTHTPGSRHYVGCAIDCDLMGPDSLHLAAVTVRNALAVEAAKWLHSQGFQYHEMGPQAAVLLGAAHTAMNETGAAHARHIHISVARPPGAVEEDAG